METVFVGRVFKSYSLPHTPPTMIQLDFPPKLVLVLVAVGGVQWQCVGGAA